MDPSRYSRYNKRLSTEYSRIMGDYKVELVEDNLHKWKVELDVDFFGTLDVFINFPPDFPFSPPSVNIPRIYHPNVFINGSLCMSILHGGRVEVGDAESIEEKWTPGFWMSSVLAAVVAILNSPNLSSPANIDAKKLYDSDYKQYVEKNKALATLRSNQKIREEQDTAYALAMKQDMLREESRHNDINVRNDGDVEEDVCKDLAEPLDDFGQKLVTIRFRSPKGNFERRFFSNAKLADVFQVLMEGGFGSSIRLLTAWPKKDLSTYDKEMNISSIGLDQQTLTISDFL